MKRSEIIPALEALTAAWEAQYGTGEIAFHWSLSDDPEPWVLLNKVHLCRACRFDEVPVEEARNKDLWTSVDGYHAFLDYDERFLYLGPIVLSFTKDYPGEFTLIGYFMIPNPANPADHEWSQNLGMDPVPMREECADCCKKHRRRCSGKAITAFPELPKGEKPKCFEGCTPDHEDCPYGPGDCDMLYEHLPDHLMKVWEESLN